MRKRITSIIFPLCFSEAARPRIQAQSFVNFSGQWDKKEVAITTIIKILTVIKKNH